MSRLRAIVYVSSAIKPMAEAELEALLVEARALNLETATTGVLLYADGNFMQCFEGSDAAIDTTYGRIRRSRKHHGLIELIDEPIATRSFADWQMGFAHASGSDLLKLSSARWQRQAAPGSHTGNDSSGMLLLKQFWYRASSGA